jgi:ketosteroid isomerase-like protein
MASEKEARNFEATRRLYELSAAGDRAGVAELLSDDLVITEGASLPYAGTYTGKAALPALSAKVAAHYGGMTLDIHEICAHGDWVLTLLDIVPAGKAERVALVEASRFDEAGKIVEIKPFYFDHDQVKRLGVG